MTADRETYATGTINNLVGYSNKTVDGLFDKLVLTSDQGEQVKIQTHIEQEMFKDAIGLPIFQFPSANIANRPALGRGSRHPGADHVLRVLEVEGPSAS